MSLILVGGARIAELWEFVFVMFTSYCALLGLVFLPRDATQSAVLARQVVRLSVCPSVTSKYCDHIGWNISNLILRLIR